MCGKVKLRRPLPESCRRIVKRAGVRQAGSPIARSDAAVGPGKQGANLPSGARLIALVFSIAEFDPDSRHAGRLIQRAEDLAETRAELFCALVLAWPGSCRSCCLRGGGLATPSGDSCVRAPVGNGTQALAAVAKLKPERLGLGLPMLDQLAKLCIPLGAARA